MARFGVLLLLTTLVTSVSGLVVPATAVSSNPIPDCGAGSTCTITFTYTGDYYRWTAPYSGEYTLEVWGAQGGGDGQNYVGTGGKGGYARGTGTLSSGADVYIYVGQRGFTSSSQNAFNGGGRGNPNSSYGAGQTGGGATHIATSVGQLSSLSSNSSSVLIVGGGGGGAAGHVSSLNSGWSAYAANGGAGGGTSGLSGASSGGDSTNRAGGGGGTQSAGGTTNGGASVSAAFGLGADASIATQDAIQGGGGGGGYYGGGAGMQAGGGGGGGSGYVGTLSNTSLTAGNASMPNPSGGVMTGRSGHGLAKITYLNSPQITSFTSAQSSPTNTSSVISYSLSFSQNVNTVEASDFSNAGSATGCTFSPSASSGTNFTLNVSGCSEGSLQPQVLANGVFGTSTNTNGPPANSLASTTITIDRTAPTISSVTAPSNGTYSPTGLPSGSTLSFSVVMSESVTVTGSPRLTLTVGSATRYATYLSQSDSRTLTFQYTPSTSLDEIDTDGIAMASSLDLNSGSITDLATNTLSDTSLTPPTLTGVLIAQRASAPTITSITAGNTQLSVAFTAGASNGAAITNYKYSVNGGSFTAFSPTDTTSPLVITGLTNGTSYAVRILAITSVGDGESSTAVTATPTSIVVGSGSDIAVTYGSVGTSSAFTASGGSAPYSFSLSPGVSGVTIDPSTGVVTTSASLAAGSYSTFVVATDSASRSGQKAISILISQETPTISIQLSGGVSSAPLGAAISIIASVSEEGSVAFFLGGSSIAGCSAVASSSGTATCSWTPGSLGSVSLTAVLTPTDSANYLSETSSALVITVVTGTSAISLSISGTPTKGSTLTITATTTDLAGKVTFFLQGKRIIGCKNKAVSSGEAICSWKVSRHGEQTLSARFTPTNTAYRASSAQVRVVGLRRVSR